MRLLRFARNDKRGFTLIEMVMMIAIAAVFCVGISRATQAQLSNAVTNRNYLIALNLARWRMAITNNLAYPAAGTTTPTSDSSFPNFTFSQVVSANLAVSGANTLRQITMDVLIGTRVIVRLNTYRSNIISYGNGS